MNTKHYRSLRLRGDYIDCEGPCRIVVKEQAGGRNAPLGVLIVSDHAVSVVNVPHRVGRKRLPARLEKEAAD